MSYIPGYRCPKCGRKLIESKVLGIVCEDMGHWAGTLDEAEKIGEEQFAFEKFFYENTQRFYDAQFDDLDIGFSCFLAGMKYQRNKG